jgi:hypothetical protein
MATKKQIAEQVMRILSGGHLKPDRTLDIREVMLAVDQVRDAQARMTVYQNVKEGTYEVPEDYLEFFESIAVNSDPTKGLSYITLPVSTIDLPYGLGIYQISLPGSVEAPFKLVQTGHLGLLNGSDAAANDQVTYCWPVGERVYFKNLAGGTSFVSAILAQSSKEIAEDADYPVPPDQEGDLLQKVTQMFALHDQQPHDEAEDGLK